MGFPGVEAVARPGAGERQRHYADLVLLELPVLLRVARTMTGQPADCTDVSSARLWGGHVPVRVGRRPG